MENKFLMLISFAVLIPVGIGVFVWIIAKFYKIIFPYILELEQKGKPDAIKNGETTSYWPKFVDIDVAIYIARSCSNMYLLFAAITALLSLIGYAGYNIYGLIDAVILALIAIGVRAMSRFAAVTGLVLYSAIKLLSFNILGFAFLLLFLLVSINGIRATFAYHKLKRDAETEVLIETDESVEVG